MRRAALTIAVVALATLAGCPGGPSATDTPTPASTPPAGATPAPTEPAPGQPAQPTSTASPTPSPAPTASPTPSPTPTETPTPSPTPEPTRTPFPTPEEALAVESSYEHTEADNGTVYLTVEGTVTNTGSLPVEYDLVMQAFSSCDDDPTPDQNVTYADNGPLSPGESADFVDGPRETTGWFDGCERADPAEFAVEDARYVDG